MIVYPSILEGSAAIAQQKIDLIQGAAGIETIQMDVIDGIFADNATITPTDMARLNFYDFTLDIHLMTEEPLDYVYECIDHKDALPIRAIIGQVERMSYQTDFIKDVLANNWQVGLALDIYTPVSAIEAESWQKISLIQVMGIPAGWQGQELKSQVYDQIKAVRHKIGTLGRDIELIVDGGVKTDNVRQLIDAGATSIAVGSGIWTAKNPHQAVNEFSSVE